MPLSRLQAEVSDKTTASASVLQRATHALLHPPRFTPNKRRRPIVLLLPRRWRLQSRLREFAAMLLLMIVMIAAIFSLAVSGGLSFASMSSHACSKGMHQPPAGCART